MMQRPTEYIELLLRENVQQDYPGQPGHIVPGAHLRPAQEHQVQSSILQQQKLNSLMFSGQSLHTEEGAVYTVQKVIQISEILYNTKCRGKRTQNIPRCILFSQLYFLWKSVHKVHLKSV